MGIEISRNSFAEVICETAVPKMFRGENDKFAENLNNFRQSEKFCDYILKTTNGEEFPVHKCVIAARSSFFEAKFNNPLYADSDSSTSELVVSSEVLGKIIEFMYTAQTTIHSDYAKEMLDTALYLGLNDLVDACTEGLIETVNVETCVGLLSYSETYHRGDKLKNTCLRFILENMYAVIETPDFLKISSYSMKKMISNYRNGCSEETLFSAIIKWISFDLEKREKFIKPLLDCVHFDKLSNEFCLTNVFQNNLLLDNRSFVEKILDKLRNVFCLTTVYQNIELLDNPRELLDIHRTVCENILKNWKEEKPIVIFKSDTDYEGLFTVFNGGLRPLNKYSFLKSIETMNQNCFGYSVINKHDLFVCGGSSNDTPTNICQYFSFNEFSWKELSKMKVARDGHRVISIDDKVYACGGQNFSMDDPDLLKMIDLVGIFKPLFSLNECEFKPLKVVRDGRRILSLNDENKIVEDLYLNSVEIFDLNKNCWMDGPDLPENMCVFGLCTLNDCIYTTYGKSVYCLDPRESSWRTLSTSLNSVELFCSSVGFENFIYRFEDENILKFDIRNNKWNYEEKKNYGMKYLQTPHACTVENDIYVLGYYEDSDKKSKYLLLKYDASNMSLLKKIHMNAQSDSFVEALFSVE